MSIRVMTLVWEHSKQQGNSLLLLLAIADFADDNGVAYPSVNTLAKKARMSERNTHYAIAGLQKAGELQIDRGAGRNGTNLYRITMNPALPLFPEERKEGGAKPAPGAKRGRGGAKPRAEGGAIAVAPEPSEPSVRTVKDAGQAKAPSPVSACFKIYREGIKRAYNAEYPPSASANGILARVVAKLGAEVAPKVVEFYLGSKKPFYVRRRHPLDVLAKDCEALYMDLQRAAGGPAEIEHKPQVLLVKGDEEIARNLGEVDHGNPPDIARRMFNSYRGMIGRMLTGGVRLKYLDVMLGKQRHRYSLAELEEEGAPS